ncbi:hypothetical protein X975_01692, partial [Stegodyphus mimosarum]
FNTTLTIPDSSGRLFLFTFSALMLVQCFLSR